MYNKGKKFFYCRKEIFMFCIDKFNKAMLFLHFLRYQYHFNIFNEFSLKYGVDLGKYRFVSSSIIGNFW